MVRASSSWVLEESSKNFNVLHEVTAERKLEDVNCVEAGVNDNDRIYNDNADDRNHNDNGNDNQADDMTADYCDSVIFLIVLLADDDHHN